MAADESSASPSSSLITLDFLAEASAVFASNIRGLAPSGSALKLMLWIKSGDVLFSELCKGCLVCGIGTCRE